MVNRVKKEITEHGISMYRMRGCRCEVCRAAGAEERKRYRKYTDAVNVRLDATPFINRLTVDGRLDEVQAVQIRRWTTKGIDLYWADHWCIRLGYHPVEIFGHLFHQQCFDCEMEAANG